MADAQDLAHTIARIGPDLCSSDESDAGSDLDDEMEVDGAPSLSNMACSVTPIWRGPALATVLSDLRYEGLYYGRNARGPRPTRPRMSTKLPPNRTPLSWIDSEYLDSPELYN